MSSQQIDPLSDANFDSEVLKAERPTIVKFWAPWSSACSRVIDGFEQVAKDFAGTVRSASVNVDANPQVASNYGVTNLPTFVLFENGRAIGRASGSASQRRLRQLFEQSRKASN